MTIDPIKLTADLVRCPSVTPEEGGAHVLLEDLLTKAGFTCTRIERGGVSNLFARWGKLGNGRAFGFNGHTDVVPIGNRDDWTHDPFGAEIHNGIMYGRGTVDMKSGVAAFVAAAVDFVAATPPDGSIVITITGDEEGTAKDGTAAILDWMAANGERMDHCLVGEPTSPNEMGEMMKIGRRGSITARFVARGVQGHAAYPHRANNPLPALVRLMDRLASHELDTGTAHFDASNLVITTIDCGNPVSNVIPAEARATVNIRFNDSHTSDSLRNWLEAETNRVAAETDIKFNMVLSVTGESFITEPGEFSEMIADAVAEGTGRRPAYSTSGGTSDARFVKSICPVAEFGLVGRGMHEVDECVQIAQITQLKDIYTGILRRYFS
jgi:succinyl-diaminopimelate desuccinylase